jgi:hemin uptake protein HemP
LGVELEQDLDQDLTRIVTRASVPQLLETTGKIKAINHNGENALFKYTRVCTVCVRVKMYLIKM